MKDLSILTNEELVAAYHEMEETERIEYEMDGSGELGHIIAEAFESTWDAFNKEFEKREIQISDHYVDDMPA